MQVNRSVAPGGALGLSVVRADGTLDPVRVFPTPFDPATPPTIDLLHVLTNGLPQRGLTPEVNAWRKANAWRRGGLWTQYARLKAAMAAHKVTEMPYIFGALYLRHFKADGTVLDLGLAGMRVVTTAGVTFLCADMAAGASDINLFKFHGFGTGGTAEASGDTALVTEETTQYNPDSTRPTGSQASSTNTYTTVGTYTPDSGFPRAITEHGIFSATSAGTLWDRTLFSVVNLASGDSLQATHVTTFPAGS